MYMGQVDFADGRRESEEKLGDAIRGGGIGKIN